MKLIFPDSGGGIDRYTKRWLYYFRKAQCTENTVLKFLYHRLLIHHGHKNGIDFSERVNCGAGLYIGHPYGITVNDSAVIGENCNIHKNVTIGQENRGKRKGTPTIGNEVWIGIGSTIVGNIKIGDDVLIAPNSYVNRDIPSHSIVIGNPCKVISRDNATEGYITHSN